VKAEVAVVTVAEVAAVVVKVDAKVDAKAAAVVVSVIFQGSAVKIVAEVQVQALADVVKAAAAKDAEGTKIQQPNNLRARKIDGKSVFFSCSFLLRRNKEHGVRTKN
jgi:hypothetical protein